jgi:hypothetical protein
MADKQIIPFGMDLNLPPLVDDSLSIIPILEPTPLTVIPPTTNFYVFRNAAKALQEALFGCNR